MVAGPKDARGQGSPALISHLAVGAWEFWTGVDFKGNLGKRNCYTLIPFRRRRPGPSPTPHGIAGAGLAGRYPATPADWTLRRIEQTLVWRYHDAADLYAALEERAECPGARRRIDGDRVMPPVVKNT